MLRGIGPKHIRMLCENTFRGGYGYTPQQVASFTLDNVFMLLCDMDLLNDGHRGRVKTLPAEQAATAVDSEGWVRGRDEHGNPIRGKILGETLCSRLTRELREKEAAEAIAKKTKRSRRTRKR